MINDHLHMLKIKMVGKAYKESKTIVRNLDIHIKRLIDDINVATDMSESYDYNGINTVMLNESFAKLKRKYYKLLKPISEHEDICNDRAEELGLAISTINCAKADYIIKMPNADNIDELLKEIEDDQATLSDYNTNVADVYADNIEEVVEELKDTGDDIVFEPVIDKDKVEEVTAAAERAFKRKLFSSKEDAFSALISSITGVCAGLFGAVQSKRMAKFASKFGTNTVITQPVLTSRNISAETINRLTKAMEIKMGLQIRVILESSFAVMDGGMVNNRLKLANYLSPSHIEYKAAKLYTDKLLSYDEILSKFSEGADLGLGTFSSDYLYVIPSILHTMDVHSEDFDILNMSKEDMYAASEASEQTWDKRSALPTYITVRIHYISNSGKEEVNETMIGIQLNPKVVSSDVLVSTIKENTFDRIKTTPQEKGYLAKVKSIATFWKKNADKGSKKVLRSNPISKEMAALSDIKTPLFHLLISDSDVAKLKAQGLDLRDGKDYEKVMSNLPIISIMIVDDRENVYMSEGPVMKYTKKDLNDFTDSLEAINRKRGQELEMSMGISR